MLPYVSRAVVVRLSAAPAVGVVEAAPSESFTAVVGATVTMVTALVSVPSLTLRLVEPLL